MIAKHLEVSTAFWRAKSITWTNRLETRGKYFCGSLHGWMVTMEKSPALYLFNPLTKIQIPLPPLSSFPYASYCLDRHGAEYVFPNKGRVKHNYSQADMKLGFVSKIVRSPTPISSNHDDYLLVAIYGYGHLAHCRYKEDRKWTAAEQTNRYFEDVIFHEGKIYATAESGLLVVADIDSFPLTFISVPIIFSRSFLGGTTSWKYLIGSSDGLMLVEMFISSQRNGERC